MMLNERDLRFIFPKNTTGFVFDQRDQNLPNYHDKGSMPRVDLIVEDENIIYFIEVKDPANPNARPDAIRRFFEDIKDGTLIESLFNKYWNTFVFRWAEQFLTKDVAYLCVISVEDYMAIQLTEALEKRLINLKNKSKRWKKHPLIHCQVLSLDAWNSFSPDWRVERISEGN